MLGSITFTLQIRHIGAGNIESTGPLSLADQQFTIKQGTHSGEALSQKLRVKSRGRCFFSISICACMHTHIYKHKY